MTVLLLLLLVVGLSASVTVLTRELRLARERGQHWYDRARFAEKANAAHEQRIAEARRIEDRAWAAIEPELAKIDAEKLRLAPWMPAGTLSNPLILTRVTDSSLDDRAWYSSLAVFCPKVIP